MTGGLRATDRPLIVQFALNGRSRRQLAVMSSTSAMLAGSSAGRRDLAAL